MVERATLKLDAGDELRVEVERDDLGDDEITVRKADDALRAVTADFLSVIDDHLEATEPRPSGTTDRLLAADRDRPY